MPDISDEEALGKYYLQELDAFSIPEELIDYIDYEAYGCNAVVSENGEFVQDGYIRRNGSSFYEFYDGQPEGIPKEYRVMSVQAEPPHIAASARVRRIWNGNTPPKQKHLSRPGEHFGAGAA